VPARAQFRPVQAPKGTESTSRPDEFHLILVCAREERAKPIGDRRGGRWSPALPLGMAPVCRTGQSGAGAEAGRGRRPRGFSVGPERTTSESEARVAARLMRRDGRSFSAGISRKPEPEHISRDRRINRQRISIPQPKRWTEGLRRERFRRSPAGARPKRPRGFSRGSEREPSEPEARVAARLMRRDGRSSGAMIFRKPERETYLLRPTE
jgi:hypothetical protein